MSLVRTSIQLARPHTLLTAAGLLAALVWLYWNTLAELAGIWAVDPQYSHGYLVPVFAVALLFFRRHQIGSGISQPSWWAVPLVLIGIAMRLLDAYFYLRWLGQASLLPLLAGICLAVGGRAALRWAWPAIAYLLFMIPLPGRLEGFLAYPLQRIATIGSTNILERLRAGGALGQVGFEALALFCI